MKKIFNVLFLLAIFISALSAYEPRHENDAILKDTNKEYAVVVIKFNGKTRTIEPCFDSIFSYYFHKKGDNDEKWCFV